MFQNHLNVGYILQTLSHSIRGLNLRGMFMGAILTKIHSGNNSTISFQIAGMPPVIKYDGNTQKTSRIIQKALPLGIKKDVNYSEVTLSVNPGDTFLLFSDGLMELFNQEREMLGLDRIEQKFQEIAHLPTHQILLEINLFWKQWCNEKQDDDITIQVFKYLG
ncbi:MAG: serine/threonine-protein phosphatase [Bacteroidia bacterium]|nr:serine/threonine-protein phosphatase [Bacteroidia bacterium]